MEDPESIGTDSSTWLLNFAPPPIAAATSTEQFANNTLFRRFPGKNSPYTTTEAILLVLVFGTIIVSTVVGNILVCVAVFLVKKLRKPCNYLLVSLAVSDLCVALLVMPMAMLYEINGDWSFGSTMCDVWVSFDVLSCTASILNLCMISVDRYYAITSPLDYGVKRTTNRMILYVFLVWFVAACISLPPLLLFGNEHAVHDSGVTTCSVSQNFGYQIYATMCSFFIPLSIMTLVYRNIFRTARKIALEEKYARSHLEPYCQLDLAAQVPPPVVQQKVDIDAHADRCISTTDLHRSSNASTTCSTHDVKYFSGGARKSNESQCPILPSGSEKQPILPVPGSTTPHHSTHGCVTLTPTRDHSQPIGGDGGVGGSGGGKDYRAVANRGRKQAENASSAISSPHKQKRLRLLQAKERKASTTLGIIMFAFTLCWLPFFVLAVVRIILYDPNDIPAWLSSIFLWLGYCNSMLNPVIYATLNRDFRKPFREILFCRCSNLQHMMREEFYQSQYGDPVNNYLVRSSNDATIVSGALTPAPIKPATSIDEDLCDGTIGLGSSSTKPSGESFL